MTHKGAADLFSALQDVEKPWLVEHSAKLLPGEVRNGRMLVSFPRRALGPGPSRRLRDICDRLGAPEVGFAHIDAVQSRAIMVHFGLEPEPAGMRFKCYVEFSRRDTPATHLAFLAVKWVPRTGGFAVSRYWRRDHLETQSRIALIGDVLPAGALREMFENLSRQADDAEAGGLLEIDELSGPRRSLDLNLADAELKVADRKACLVSGLGRFSGAQDYLEGIAGDKLGHIAAGTSREGQAFATVYHGAHFMSEMVH